MIKRIVSFIVSLVMLFSLFGCGKDNETVNVPETNDEKLQAYKSMVTEFFDALVVGDYTKAADYFFTESGSSFKEYCQKAETDNNFKFSDGYEIRRYTEEYYTEANDNIGGVIYLYTIHVNFGETRCYSYVHIRDDGEKVGIINFEIGSRDVG